MRPPYPTDIVPLLPQFLQRRRTKLEYPLRAAEELGIDRPAFILAMSLGYADDRGWSPETLYSPYETTRERLAPALAAARGAGLVEERGDRWHMTAKGREYVARTRAAAHEHLGMRRTIDERDLRRLADLLERAWRASEGAAEPPQDRRHRAVGFRGDAAPASALAALENAVMAHWLFRDDCHIAAWRAARVDGPTLDVLTRIWREEAPTEAELASKMALQRQQDVSGALARLRAAGHVAPGEPLRATEPGHAFRRRIEDETDRLFFAPWPDGIGREGAWIRDQLEAVNAALA